MLKVQIIPAAELTTPGAFDAFGVTCRAPILIVLADAGHILQFGKLEMRAKLLGHYHRLCLLFPGGVYLVPGFGKVTDNFNWQETAETVRGITTSLKGKFNFVHSRCINISDPNHPGKHVSFLVANLFRPVRWNTPAEAAAEQARVEANGSLAEQLVFPIRTDLDFINNEVLAAEASGHVRATVVIAFLPSYLLDYRPEDDAVKQMTSRDFRKEPFWTSNKLLYLRVGKQARGCTAGSTYCSGSLSEVLRPGIQSGSPFRGTLAHCCSGVILEI